MTDTFQEQTLAIVPECPEAGPVDSFTAAILKRGIARKKLGRPTDDPETAFRIPFDVRSRAYDDLGETAASAAFTAGMQAALLGEDAREIQSVAWDAAWTGREAVVDAHPNVRSHRTAY